MLKEYHVLPLGCFLPDVCGGGNRPYSRVFGIFIERRASSSRHGLRISLSVSIVMCVIFYFLYIARLAIIFFKLASFSSSEMEGSFIKRPQGKSGHPSTIFPLLFLTAFQMGHTASPVYWSQNTLPFIFLHPLHSFGNDAQSTHLFHTEGIKNHLSNTTIYISLSGFSVWTKYSKARYR